MPQCGNSFPRGSAGLPQTLDRSSDSLPDGRSRAVSRRSSLRRDRCTPGVSMGEAASIRVWEEAEIERSRAEASHTPLQGLRMDEANVQRYMNPSPATPYPLEYAFHLLGDVSGSLVLDLGCGNGENSLLVARRQARVIGLDVSESLLG